MSATPKRAPQGVMLAAFCHEKEIHVVCPVIGSIHTTPIPAFAHYTMFHLSDRTAVLVKVYM
jgi:hypothetical protein